MTEKEAKLLAVEQEDMCASMYEDKFISMSHSLITYSRQRSERRGYSRRDSGLSSGSLWFPRDFVL